jgi:hypothetical protein
MARSKVLEVATHGTRPVVVRDRFRQCGQRGAQATHHLDRSNSVPTYLIEGEREIILPGRHRRYEAGHSIRVGGIAVVQVVSPQTKQQVLDLIEGVDRGSRVVDRGDSALMAISTRRRIAYFGSCWKMRSVPRRTPFMSCFSSSGSFAP